MLENFARVISIYIIFRNRSLIHHSNPPISASSLFFSLNAWFCCKYDHAYLLSYEQAAAQLAQLETPKNLLKLYLLRHENHVHMLVHWYKGVSNPILSFYHQS